jgi:hypothetical protein
MPFCSQPFAGISPSRAIGPITIGAFQVGDDANLILCIRPQKRLVILATVKHTDD